MDTMTKTAQINLNRLSARYWRITFDNPPLNLMGPQFVREFRDIMTAIEADEQDALATRIAAFDKWAIAKTNSLVNASLPSDVELGFHKPGPAEDHMGAYLGRIGR
jgi:hypothetical protein